jgi:hypothetical protein
MNFSCDSVRGPETERLAFLDDVGREHLHAGCGAGIVFGAGGIWNDCPALNDNFRDRAHDARSQMPLFSVRGNSGYDSEDGWWFVAHAVKWSTGSYVNSARD